MKDINLVPKSYLQKKKKKKMMVFYSFFGLVAIAVITVIVLIPVLKIQSLESKMASLELNEKELSKYRTTEREFEVLKNMYLQRESEANRLSDSGIDLLKIIEKLESYLTERIFIESIVANKGGNNQIEVSIRGIAGSEEEIASFSNYISKDDYFNSIKIRTLNAKYTQDSNKEDNKDKSSVDSQNERSKFYSFDAVIYLTAGK